MLISLKFGGEQQEETPLRTTQAVAHICAAWAKCQNANTTPRGYQTVHKRFLEDCKSRCRIGLSSASMELEAAAEVATPSSHL